MKRHSLLVICLLLFPSFCFSADERGIQIVLPGSTESSYLGTYYAYIVGINAYQEYTPLQTAVKDARELRDTLISLYDFDDRRVFLRTDEAASQRNLMSEMRELAAGLKENDNLLIYYAGHGTIDSFTGEGYWIPVDGKRDNPATWVPHSLIKNILSTENLKGKNIVLISDSCYSGAFLRSGEAVLPLSDSQYRQKILARSALRSRQVFTSGGVEPVLDGGRDGHSVFAYYFLKALRENQLDVIDLENLFHTQVWGPVAQIGDQRPYIGRLKTMMDENGQFVMLLRSAKEKFVGQQASKDFAALSPKFFQKTISNIKPKMIIAPAYFGNNVTSTFYGIREYITKALKKAPKNNPDIEIAISFYDLGQNIPAQILSPDIVNEDNVNTFYIKKSFFSSDETLNYEQVAKFGIELKADMVFLHHYRIECCPYKLILDLYIYEIEKNTTYHEKINIAYGGAISTMDQSTKAIEQFFVEYKTKKIK
jgi:hypothetical protein